MNQKTTITACGGALIAIIIIILVVFNTQSIDTVKNREFEEKKTLGPDAFQPLANNWQSSGPFKINRDKYLLGENLFIRGENLNLTDEGQIVILHPKNQTHDKVYTTISYDGLEKSSFNAHFTPQLSKFRGICDKTQFIGTWKVVFQGTEYETLEFKMINETLPGFEKDFEPVC